MSTLLSQLPQLSTMNRNSLQEAGFKTLESLQGVSTRDLLNVRNFGLKSLYRLAELLSSHGLAPLSGHQVRITGGGLYTLCRSREDRAVIEAQVRPPRFGSLGDCRE